MIVFTQEDLNERCKLRPLGYRRAVMKVAQKGPDGKYVIPFEAAQLLRKKYSNKIGFHFKVRSFFSHLVKNASIILRGKNPIAPKMVSKRRMDICLQCPYINLEYKACKACGCYLPAKTSLVKAECPLKKWN